MFHPVYTNVDHVHQHRTPRLFRHQQKAQRTDALQSFAHNRLRFDAAASRQTLEDRQRNLRYVDVHFRSLMVNYMDVTIPTFGVYERVAYDGVVTVVLTLWMR